MAKQLLSVEGVSVSFGGIAAVSDVSLNVAESERLGIIGANGAGKTTLLNAISGIVHRTGHIEFDSKSLDGLHAYELAWLGIARTFQLAEHFRDFTLIEYVMLGEFATRRPALLRSTIGLPTVWRSERELRQQAFATLVDLGIESAATQPLSSLPYGYQKLADVCRTLITKPRLILFDEPTSGCAVSEREALRRTFEVLRQRGIATVLVDHDPEFVSQVVERIILMDGGCVVAEGSPVEVLGGEAAKRAYLGTSTRVGRDAHD
jgi:ABC-type branched-subunit amino acid transport system ATPase component